MLPPSSSFTISALTPSIPVSLFTVSAPFYQFLSMLVQKSFHKALNTSVPCSKLCKGSLGPREWSSKPQMWHAMYSTKSPKLTTLQAYSAQANQSWAFTSWCFCLHGSFSRMLRCDSQKAPCQVICGRRLESQTISELERTQKATLQMRKLRLIGLPKATQLFIRMAGWARLVRLEGGNQRAAY